MGWLCGKIGRLKAGKGCRCPESGGKTEVRKTENVMGGLC